MDVDVPSGHKHLRLGRTQRLNKQAQQRFRDRKKRKVEDLGQSVAELSKQLNDLASMENENRELQERNQELLLELEATEEEIIRVVPVLRTPPDASGTLEVAEGTDTASPDGLPNTGAQSASEPSMVLELRALLLKYDLQTCGSPDINGDVVPPEVSQRVSELVAAINTAQRKALQMDTDQVPADGPSSEKRSERCEVLQWELTAQGLRLSEKQMEEIREARAHHLRRLQDIYRERSLTSVEAFGVLLPKARGGTAPCMGMMDRVKSWFSFPSLITRTKHASRTNAIMKALEDSLGEEQRAASELDYLVFRRILTPVQGSFVTLQKYPACPDILSLCTAIVEGADLGSC